MKKQFNFFRTAQANFSLAYAETAYRETELEGMGARQGAEVKLTANQREAARLLHGEWREIVHSVSGFGR